MIFHTVSCSLINRRGIVDESIILEEEPIDGSYGATTNSAVPKVLLHGVHNVSSIKPLLHPSLMHSLTHSLTHSLAPSF